MILHGLMISNQSKPIVGPSLQGYLKLLPDYLSAKFPKNERFLLPCSTNELHVVNQRRRPNPTVAPREVKLRCWFFGAGCRFLLHNVFLQTASRYESRERFRDKSMHKCMIRIYTDFHWKNTDFPHEIVACLLVLQNKQPFHIYIISFMSIN